jgi:Host cell surface-exposed lipoprotein
MPKLTMTKAQAEAVEAAESYLDFGHFSKKGLTHQLTSKYGEGFSKADAKFAVDHVKADWNAEAVEAAESYLDSGHFSRKGLIEQLESPYGGQFTHDQAVYGVNQAGL